MSDLPEDFQNARLSAVDPDIARVLDRELERQQGTLEMIASENFVPQAVLEAAGSVLTPHILQRLKERGIQHVRIHPLDVMRLTGRTSVSAPAKPVEPVPERQAGATWAVTAESFVHKIARHGASPYKADAVALYESAFNDSVATMDRLVEGLSTGTLHEAPELVVASALNPRPWSQRAEPRSKGLGMTKQPRSWSACKNR